MTLLGGIRMVCVKVKLTLSYKILWDLAAVSLLFQLQLSLQVVLFGRR